MGRTGHSGMVRSDGFLENPVLQTLAVLQCTHPAALLRQQGEAPFG